MRRVLLLWAVILSALPCATHAQSTSYMGVQKQYSTSQVIAILGREQTVTQPHPLAFDIDVSAGVSTSLACGALGVNFSVPNMVKTVNKIPAQLVAQAQALLAAMPMLTLCYASPSLCAELKNVNFQINEKIKGLTNVCKSINEYISGQSSTNMVRLAAQSEAVKQCVADDMANTGDDMPTALDLCNATPQQPLYTDIAKGWLSDTFTRAPQNVISALLQGSGQLTDSLDDQQYHFLSALLGEMKLEVNGKLYPVFPDRPFTAAAVAKNIRGMAVQMACDQGRLTSAVNTRLMSTNTNQALAYQEQALYDVAFSELFATDVTNLFGLDPPDSRLACNALGRALTRAAMQKLADEGQSAIVRALQNPAAPQAVKEAVSESADKSFRALRDQMTDRDLTIRDVRKIINDMMQALIRTRHVSAAAVSAGMKDSTELDYFDCDSEDTCQ